MSPYLGGGRQAGAPATIALHFVRAMLGVRVKRLVVVLFLVEKDNVHPSTAGGSSGCRLLVG